MISFYYDGKSHDMPSNLLHSHVVAATYVLPKDYLRLHNKGNDNKAGTAMA